MTAKHSGLVFFAGLVAALAIILIGFNAVTLMMLVCVTQMVLFLMRSQDREDPEQAILSLLSSCISGAIFYLVLFFIGMMVFSHLEYVYQVFMPLAFLYAAWAVAYGFPDMFGDTMRAVHEIMHPTRK